jgi:ABC-2 type transport system permease protein
VFLSIGVLLGCAIKRYKRASSAALFLLLGTYFLSVVTIINQDLNFLKYFSPFRYFDPADILHSSSVNIGFVGLSIVIVAISLVVARITYEKRDLYI